MIRSWIRSNDAHFCVLVTFGRIFFFIVTFEFLRLFLRVVKLTSPNLNYVIVFGTILLMSGNIFTHPPSTNLELQAVFCLVGEAFMS